jgi:hypothetical protein
VRLKSIGLKTGRHLQRLAALEGEGHHAQQRGCIVIYDAETGQPITPTAAGAAVQVWLPAKRGAVHEPDSAPIAGA